MFQRLGILSQGIILWQTTLNVIKLPLHLICRFGLALNRPVALRKLATLSLPAFNQSLSFVRSSRLLTLFFQELSRLSRSQPITFLDSVRRSTFQIFLSWECAFWLHLVHFSKHVGGHLLIRLWNCHLQDWSQFPSTREAYVLISWA